MRPWQAVDGANAARRRKAERLGVLTHPLADIRFEGES